LHNQPQLYGVGYETACGVAKLSAGNIGEMLGWLASEGYFKWRLG
jgi:hypothetical protein